MLWLRLTPQGSAKTRMLFFYLLFLGKTNSACQPAGKSGRSPGVRLCRAGFGMQDAALEGSRRAAPPSRPCQGGHCPLCGSDHARGASRRAAAPVRHRWAPWQRVCGRRRRRRARLPSCSHCSVTELQLRCGRSWGTARKHLGCAASARVVLRNAGCYNPEEV